MFEMAWMDFYDPDNFPQEIDFLLMELEFLVQKSEREPLTIAEMNRRAYLMRRIDELEEL